MRRSLWARRLLLLAGVVVAGCAGDKGGSGRQDLDPGGPVPASFDVNRLIGLDSGQVAGLLGPADFRRTDGPAEILQYRGTACVLDVYLYREDGSGDFRTTYLAARDRQLARMAPQACLASVIRAKRG
jgi:hypothetical protein